MASQSSAPGRSRPPTDDLEDWDVGSRIGKGSFATVFSGTHKVRFSALTSPTFLSRPMRQCLEFAPPRGTDPGTCGSDKLERALATSFVNLKY